MSNVRIGILALLALAARFPVAGQSVVATHSGVVYFFTGAVYIGDERLEQKFGRFPDIGEGRELRTEQGRAEVLLTPGVILRVAENSSVRLLSAKLSDTRVELLSGSAILEATDPAKEALGKDTSDKDTSVTLIHKQWQVRLPGPGACRIDAAGPQIQVYKGEAEVLAEGSKEPVVVKESEVLPLAEVLVAEASTAPDTDSFKRWAMNRSQAIAADNATAADIVDDPSQLDNSGLAMGSFSYFPLTGAPSLGIGNPYGLSFWSSYQSVLASAWLPSYLYGPYGGYGPVYGGLHAGWPVGINRYPSPIYFPRPVGTSTWPGGTRPGVTAPTRIYAPPRTYTPARVYTHAPAPAPVILHPPAHR